MTCPLIAGIDVTYDEVEAWFSAYDETRDKDAIVSYVKQMIDERPSTKPPIVIKTPWVFIWAGWIISFCLVILFLTVSNWWGYVIFWTCAILFGVTVYFVGDTWGKW